MIRALPQQRNRVIVSNAARNQQFLGVNWHGTLTRPNFALVRIQTGEKPMPVQGYDLLGHEGRHAAYGDRKLLRHAMDSNIDQATNCFSPVLGTHDWRWTAGALAGSQERRTTHIRQTR